MEIKNCVTRVFNGNNFLQIKNCFKKIEIIFHFIAQVDRLTIQTKFIFSQFTNVHKYNKDKKL